GYAASVTASGFAQGQLHFFGDFDGELTAPGLAASSIQIDGAMAAGSHLQVDSIGSFKVGVPLDDAAPNPFAASDSPDLAGTVEVLGPIDTVSLGASLTQGGSISAATIHTVTIHGDLAGQLTETSPTKHLQALTVDGSIAAAVVVQGDTVLSVIVGKDL